MRWIIFGLMALLLCISITANADETLDVKEFGGTFEVIAPEPFIITKEFGTSLQVRLDNLPPSVTNPECQNMTWDDTDRILDHTPYFDWNFTDPDDDTQHGYHIEIGNDTEWTTAEIVSNNCSVMCEESTNNYYIYAGDQLQDGNTYYWRVKAMDNHSVWSDWTADQRFQMNTLPGIPTLIAPSNNSYNLPYQQHSITLNWTEVSDADGDSPNYWWQYARDSDFTTDVHGGWSTGNTYKQIPQTENLMEQTEYYWHVRAYDGQENGSWSAWRTFETDEIIDLTDLSIADGAENIALDTAIWDINITHNDGYSFDWWINTTPDVGNNSNMSDDDGIKNTSLGTLWYNTTYSVQVVVDDNQGAKRNETYTFTTEKFYGDNNPPTNVYVNQTTNSSLDLSWMNNGNNRTILVRNETGTGSYDTDLVNATELYNGTGTQYEDIDLTQGITYYYTFWSYNDTTGLYSTTYAEGNNTVKVMSLSITVAPKNYDFATVNIPGTYRTTNYTFNLSNDGLDASIEATISNSQNWSFGNYSDRGLDAFCVNWSEDNWTTAENIKTDGIILSTNISFNDDLLFDIAFISPAAITAVTNKEEWTMSITATPR